MLDNVLQFRTKRTTEAETLEAKVKATMCGASPSAKKRIVACLSGLVMEPSLESSSPLPLSHPSSDGTGAQDLDRHP